MPQSQVSFQNMFTPKIFRYVRTTFGGVGVDNFIQPPSQDPDMFEELTNIMPVTDGGLRKRWGYQLWNSSNLIEAKHIYEYENNTTTLRNILFMVADGTGVASTTNNVNAYSEPGVFNTTIFTPAAHAFSPYAVVSRDYAYFSDGVASDLKKWNGSTLSNWGIAPPSGQIGSSGAPVGAVSVNVVSGISTSWAASTVYSTMGILVDANNNLQQLTSVNATGFNTTQLGSTGNGQPNWNQTQGGTTVDNTITWQNAGQIGVWQGNTAYPQFSPIYDQASGGVYMAWQPGTNTSQAARPNFSGVSGTYAFDFNNTDGWACIGNVATLNSGVNQDIRPWTPNTAFQRFDKSPGGIVEPIPMPAFGSPLPAQPIYVQFSTTAGTTGTGGTPFLTTALAGVQTLDNQLIWTGGGTATWAANKSVTQWEPASTGTIFSAVKDANGNIQVCSTSGTTGTAAPTWSTVFGVVTPEVAPGTASWTCVGPSLSWAASTQWFLPVNGFVMPTNVEVLGGTEIKDSNGNQEFVIASGISGATSPTWATVVGSTTIDGTVTWKENGVFVAVTGDITLVDGRQYFTVFRNSITGNISDLSPVSDTTGPITNDAVQLSNLPISTDPQVTDLIILATPDGNNQTLLYFVGSVPNGTTTYLDTTTAIALLNNNIYQETDQYGNLIGVANNSVPLPGKFLTAYKGRLYMIYGQTLLFSKSLADLLTSTGTITGRWEEDWPPGYQLDISNISETPRGLQTDGQALYIGTERQIHRLLGDGPANFTQPEVIFNEVGILNQKVWHPVFIENQPVGAMWLTPDNRVVGSDYNTYQDVGQSIQTTLNSINIAAANTSWGMFVSNGQFDLYLLAIPTGSNTLPDTICVFDMRSRQWFIWEPTDTVSAGVFNIDVTGLPQWIFTALSGKTYNFVSSTYQDRTLDVSPTNFPSTIRTTWQTPFDPTFRQVLNVFELMTGDATTLVTIEGAVSEADFTTPNVLLANAPITSGLFGELNVMLVGTKAGYRWYRFTFTSNGIIPNLLQGWSIESIPMGQY